MASSETTVRLSFDGRTIVAEAGSSLLQARMAAGEPVVDHVGCMGQGVCGACRVLVRRAGSDQVTTALACETPAEAGMQVSSVDHFPSRRPHAYDLGAVAGADVSAERILAVFPEAAHCRHCAGCTRACPKGIAVEDMVNLAATGNVGEAAALFDDCVMCNLCVAACPEDIDPAHLGQFVRRLTAVAAPVPRDLDERLREIDAGSQTIQLPKQPPERGG